MRARDLAPRDLVLVVVQPCHQHRATEKAHIHDSCKLCDLHKMWIIDIPNIPEFCDLSERPSDATSHVQHLREIDRGNCL
jgi:hypothetical protein